ncbi:progonadoliberin-2 [Spea bombifrons]|uniref:progonadoliberin-2 n=1 Tax=Spea bombifrons TaxID=233779 RepID=UPI00234AE5B2|nr:progonadoliberin-2 [Spea bombifrons]XP_053314164.1 progonadoliberin-2 [Spea bombifrons]
MACQRHLVLLLVVLLAVSTQLSNAQHWSHGWYPGGKRELSVPSSPEVSEEIKLCEGEECAYLRNPRKSMLKNILAELLSRQLQKK